MPRSASRLVLLSLAALAIAGCRDASDAPASSTRASLAHDYVLPKASGLGRSEQGLTAGDGPDGQQVLYVNFSGASISVVDSFDDAGDNAALNQSVALDLVAPGSTIAFPAFDTTPYTAGGAYTDATAKAKIMADVQGWFASYNVYVVTTRPTSGRYTMVMVGGKASDYYSGSDDAVGVASLDCGNQSQTNIGYAFATTINADAPTGTTAAQTRDQNLLLVAQTVAHEAGHTFGLEHVDNPKDIMDPSVSPSVTGFLAGGNSLSDPPAECGSSSLSQDDDARLRANLGPAPVGTGIPKPVITWLAPTNGETVPTQFTLQVSVSEPTGATGTITKVEILEEGELLATLTSSPYVEMFDTKGQVGDFELTALAFNSEGGIATSTVDFTIAADGKQPVIGCLVNADCGLGDSCSAGTCVAGVVCSPACAADEACQSDGTCKATPDMSTSSGTDGGVVVITVPTAPVGTTCTTSATCGTAGLCASGGSGKSYCTVQCDPAGPSCPADYACRAVGADHYCAPTSSGGCDYAGGGSSRGAPLVLLFGLFACFSRRRRPSAT